MLYLPEIRVQSSVTNHKAAYNQYQIHVYIIVYSLSRRDIEIGDRNREMGGGGRGTWSERERERDRERQRGGGALALEPVDCHNIGTSSRYSLRNKIANSLRTERQRQRQRQQYIQMVEMIERIDMYTVDM